MNDPRLEAAWRAHREGNLLEAGRLYVEVLRKDPMQFDALYGLGVSHYQRGEFAEAERELKRAVERNPTFPDPWFTLACALHRLERSADALVAFDRALAIRPGFVEALVNKGGVLMGLRRYDEALAVFDRALKLNPAMAQAWNNRGNVLSGLGRNEEAVASYDKVLQLHPNLPQAQMNKGTALVALKRYEAALSTYGEALRADPTLAAARGGQANALFHMKRYDDAAREYASALRSDSKLAYGRGNLAYARINAADWRAFDEDKAALATAVAEGARAVNPFQALALLESEELQARAAAIFMGDKYGAVSHTPWTHAPYKHERIRLAYLSAEFHEHAVSTQLAGVIERHDRQRFETIGISLAAAPDSAMRARLKNAFERFVDAEAMSDEAIAKLLKDLEVDIAIDLMGFTGDSRPGILAQRAAPVQVNYLGFPGTMASAHMDYIVADPTVIPPASHGWYAEAVAYLAGCYMPADSTRAISAMRPMRAQLGLPQEGFVFAAFNNVYKFTPAMFALWMRLLKAVKGAVLWLAEPNPAAARHLRQYAQTQGVAPERLVFAPFAARSEDHLARLGLADLFLDTLPYNAHATACDALWAGLPVLTCTGTTFAGRVGASVLTAAGLPELIAPTLEDYEKRATAIARDPAMLAGLKAKLTANRTSCGLFDTALYARRLEALFTSIWLRQQRGLPPAAMDAPIS